MTIKTETIDPYPRKYSAAVSLERRDRRDPRELLPERSLEEVRGWLLRDAVREGDLMVLFAELCRRLTGAGLPVTRVSLHIRTLHPQVAGFGWFWRSDDGITDEIKVDRAVLLSDVYRLNPLFRVLEHGELLDLRPMEAAVQERFAIMKELAEEGITHYIAAPMGSGERY